MLCLTSHQMNVNCSSAEHVRSVGLKSSEKMRKFLIILVSIITLPFLDIAVQGMWETWTHPEDSKHTEIYQVMREDDDGLYYAENERGQVMFSEENVVGLPVYIHAVVSITIDSANRNPVVELYQP